MNDIIPAVIITAIIAFLYFIAMRQNSRANRAEAALARIEATVEECGLALVERVEEPAPDCSNDTRVLQTILANWRLRDEAAK